MTEPEGILSGSGDSSQTNDTPNAVAAPGTTAGLEGSSTRSIGRYLPTVGDRCVIEGQLVEIVTFDTAANLFTAEMQVGRSVNRVTAHISNTRFEPLDGDKLVVTGDGLDLAQSESSMVHSPEQETVDEGLSRITASQGNQFTSYDQQHLLAHQPQAGDSQDVALEKLSGESVDTATPAESE